MNKTHNPYRFVLSIAMALCLCLASYAQGATPVSGPTPQALTIGASWPGHNQSVTMTVTVTGVLPISYQWQKQNADQSFTSISGATGSITVPSAAAVYNMPAVAVTDSGTYRCVVSNSGGTVVSNNGVLTVVGPPVITGNTTTSP